MSPDPNALNVAASSGQSSILLWCAQVMNSTTLFRTACRATLSPLTSLPDTTAIPIVFLMQSIAAGLNIAP